MSSIKEVIGAEIILGRRKAFVAFCDRDIGMTLKYLRGQDNALCINRQEFINMSKMSDKIRQYHESFTDILNQIKSGKILRCHIYHARYWYSCISVRGLLRKLKNSRTRTFYGDSHSCPIGD